MSCTVFAIDPLRQVLCYDLDSHTTISYILESLALTCIASGRHHNASMLQGSHPLPFQVCNCYYAFQERDSCYSFEVTLLSCAIAYGIHLCFDDLHLSLIGLLAPYFY
jgi:hypothetical protein